MTIDSIWIIFVSTKFTYNRYMLGDLSREGMREKQLFQARMEIPHT